MSVLAPCALVKPVAWLWPCPPTTSCLLPHLVRQDGFMDHNFYYGYLLLLCCMGKTNAVRFRLQTPAKPSRAVCEPLSQQHPAPCLEKGEWAALQPADVWPHSPAAGPPGSTCAPTFSERYFSECCICTCWEGSRGGTGDCCWVTVHLVWCTVSWMILILTNYCWKRTFTVCRGMDPICLRALTCLSFAYMDAFLCQILC